MHDELIESGARLSALIQKAVKDDAARHVDDEGRQAVSGTVSKPGRFYRAVDGILLLDKALGLSSNAALQQVRALVRGRQGGACGQPRSAGIRAVAGVLRAGDQGLRPAAEFRQDLPRARRARRAHRVGRRRDRSRRACRRTAAGRCVRRRGARDVPGRAAAGAADALGAEIRRQAPVRAGAAGRIGRARAAPDRHPSHCARAVGAPTTWNSTSTARRGLTSGLSPRTSPSVSARWATSGVCADCRSTRSAACPCTRSTSWPALTAEARDALLLQPDHAFLDLPRIELSTAAVEGLLQGRTVAARSLPRRRPAGLRRSGPVPRDGAGCTRRAGQAGQAVRGRRGGRAR